MSDRLAPAVRARVAEALPGADVGRAEVIGEGWGSVAYRVPAPDGDLVVRVPRIDAAEVTGDLEREVRLLPLLEKAGLPTPHEARGIYDERGCLVAAVHRIVEGEPATRARLGRGRRRERLVEEIGGFLTRLHGIPRQRALAAGVRELDLWRERYRPMFGESRGLLGPQSREWLDATAERFLAEGGMDGAPSVLVHGDIAAEHIRVRPPAAAGKPGGDGSLAGVIDFGDALLADPALDFGGLLLAYGWPFTERVLAHYGGEVDAHLRRRAQFYVDVVPIFLVRFGHQFNEGRERLAGLRQFAARAAAARRSARP
jgi:aminoglycoside phosphotransferase (APT) family kinase protein